ncbi:MAG: XisI protein [Cyanobacteria bacterium P01_F01_bin.150]
MATLNPVGQLSAVLHQILQEYCDILNRNTDKPTSTVIVNDDHTRYLVITEGWKEQTRVHTLIFDAELRNSKIWLHHDGLDHGITEDLHAAGVSKDQIVLAFHPPHIREHTGYAIA